MEYAHSSEGDAEIETPLLDLLTNQKFVDVVHAVTFSDTNDPKRLDEQLREIEQRFLPLDYDTREASFIAHVYDPESLEEENYCSSLEVVSGAKLNGLTRASLADGEHVFFEFEHHEIDEGTGPDGKTSRYLVPANPELVLSMQLAGEAPREMEPLPFRYRIELFTESSQGMISSEEFKQGDDSQRQQMLELLYLDARSLLAGENGSLGGEVSLSCSALYVAREGASVRNIENELITPDLEEDLFVVTGKNCRIFFPELSLYPTRRFNSLQDFSMGAGTPCVSVRDANDTCSYWIPIDAIHGFVPHHTGAQ